MGFKDIINGKIGELTIANRLGWSNLFGYKGTILRNIYIPTDDGTTTEIDLLFITQKGIFVIESKNYVGYIFGSEKQYKWTVTLYGGKDFIGRNKVEKYHFLNPIIQNKNHIKWLQNYIGQEIPMFSCIVFADCGNLKNITLEENSNVIVCYRTDINNRIKRIWNNNPDFLSEEEITALTNQLSVLSKVDKDVKRKHIENIKEKQNSLICPKCGGKLVLRIASKGKNIGNKFYGCENYPSCRYIKNIANR